MITFKSTGFSHNASKLTLVRQAFYTWIYNYVFISYKPRTSEKYKYYTFTRGSEALHSGGRAKNAHLIMNMILSEFPLQDHFEPLFEYCLNEAIFGLLFHRTLLLTFFM